MSGTVEAFRLHAWPVASSNRLVLIGGLVQGIKACQYNTFLQTEPWTGTTGIVSYKTIHIYTWQFMATSVEFTLVLMHLPSNRNQKYLQVKYLVWLTRNFTKCENPNQTKTAWLDPTLILYDRACVKVSFLPLCDNEAHLGWAALALMFRGTSRAGSPKFLSDRWAFSACHTCHLRPSVAFH